MWWKKRKDKYQELEKRINLMSHALNSCVEKIEKKQALLMKLVEKIDEKQIYQDEVILAMTEKLAYLQRFKLKQAARSAGRRTSKTGS